MVKKDKFIEKAQVLEFLADQAKIKKHGGAKVYVRIY